MTEFKEQFHLRRYASPKIRNRCEAHMVEYAQKLLAEPVSMTIGQVRMDLCLHLDAYKEVNPTHGNCRISQVSGFSTVMGKPHIVTRSLAIYGRGRLTATLLITESVEKDANNDYAPRIR